MEKVLAYLQFDEKKLSNFQKKDRRAGVFTRPKPWTPEYKCKWEPPMWAVLVCSNSACLHDFVKFLRAWLNSFFGVLRGVSCRFVPRDVHEGMIKWSGVEGWNFFWDAFGKFFE